MSRTRFPWHRNSAGGFIAHPEGEAATTRYATIERNDIGHGDRSWRWHVFYDASKSFHGYEGSQQACADAAVEAWPRAKADAAQLAAQAADEAALRTMVQRMVTKGDLPLSAFGIEQSSTERLTSILWLVRDANGLNGPAKPLAEAVSAELYRRRTGRSSSVTLL